jgi:hypothetical protein
VNTVLPAVAAAGGLGGDGGLVAVPDRVLVSLCALAMGKKPTTNNKEMATRAMKQLTGTQSGKASMRLRRWRNAADDRTNLRPFANTAWHGLPSPTRQQ